MRSRLMLLAVLLSLSACWESGDNLHHASNPPRVVEEGMSVLVAHVRNGADARPFADQHCKRYGRAAQFKQVMRYSRTTNSASFDCVP
jgi:hypothetical protein